MLDADETEVKVDVELDSAEELLDGRDEDDEMVCSAANCIVSFGFLGESCVSLGFAKKEVRCVGS